MKKKMTAWLLCLLMIMAVGCASEDAGNTEVSDAAEETTDTQIANPWVDYASLEEAEAAVGFDFGIDTTIAEVYTAKNFRAMNDELLEIIYYTEEDNKIVVRKKAGEGQDISGDYTEYETITETEYDEGTVTSKSDGTAVVMALSADGYSYSIYAPNGMENNAYEAFIDQVF